MTSARKARIASASQTPAAGALHARWAVLATVFMTGAGVLVVEIAGARVVSPLYGSGLYSWSALISVTLAALSLGYWAGGRAADRRPDPSLFHSGILLAGLLVIAIPKLASNVLRVTEPFDPRVGVLLAAMLLFFLPLAVLGGVTPFAIRLVRPPQGEVGAVSGLIFAVSTIGSLLAALATGFLLIPNLGVRTILALTGATLMLTAAGGFLLAGRRLMGGMATGLMTLALLAWRGASAAEAPSGVRLIDSTPSFYGHLRVIEAHDFRIMTVNGIGQTYVPLNSNATAFPYLGFVAAIPRMREKLTSRPTALLIGLGAGQLVDLLESGGVDLTVVEIDPRVEAVARRHFGLTLPHDRVHLEDGRAFLERDRGTYDYVLMDAFIGEDVPGHLFTREALSAVRRRLTADGVVVINYTTIPGGKDAGAVAKTLESVFPHVQAFTDGTEVRDVGSLVFVASPEPLGLDSTRVATGSGVRLFLSNELRIDTAGSTLLTDDFNPINSYRLGANRLWRQAMVSFLGDDRAFWGDF